MVIEQVKSILETLAMRLGIDKKYAWMYMKDATAMAKQAVIVPLGTSNEFVSVNQLNSGGYIRVLNSAIGHDIATYAGCSNSNIKLTYYFTIVKWNQEECSLTKLWEQMHTTLVKNRYIAEDIEVLITDSWFLPTTIVEYETEANVTHDLSKMRMAKFDIKITIDNIESCNLESNYC